MLISSFSTLTVFAAPKTQGTADLNTQISKAADYAASQMIQGGSIAGLSYQDCWTLVEAGYDLNTYEALYLARLDNDLSKNSGKIIIEGEEWYQDAEGNWQSYSYSYEDIAVYAAAILTLNKMGIDVTNYNGYNLTTPFLNFDLSKISNPYSYRLATYAAISVLKNSEFARTLAEDMISRFYTLGKGLDYYGFSCDNTGQFLAALYPLVVNNVNLKKYNLDKYVDDACGVIKTFTKENGAYADEVYVTTVNADSTALAMLGFSAALDVENAYWYYQMLIDGFYNASTGAFMAVNSSGEIADNLYATKDALVSLTRFKDVVALVHYYDDADTVYSPAGFNHNGFYLGKCPICGDLHNVTVPALDSITLSNTNYVYNGKAKRPAVTVKDVKGTPVDKKYYTVTYKSNKNVGKGTVTITFKGIYTGTVNKSIKIVPQGTSVSAFTVARKGFTVSWKKQATQTTGYQVQYSATSKFTKSKTLTVKKNSTTKKAVGKLAANKKYFVRVRTYKTVNGKNYYSKWSAAKSVKTK